MARLKKTWREKLAEDKDLPKVVEITENLRRRWDEGTVAIPAPREVDEIMRRVPRGRLITINRIRETVARRHGATIGCPITTGIFAGIAAKAAEEDAADGITDITPYWRTLKAGGELNPKYPRRSGGSGRPAGGRGPHHRPPPQGAARAGLLGQASRGLGVWPSSVATFGTQGVQEGPGLARHLRQGGVKVDWARASPIHCLKPT